MFAMAPELVVKLNKLNMQIFCVYFDDNLVSVTVNEPTANDFFKLRVDFSSHHEQIVLTSHHSAIEIAEEEKIRPILRIERDFEPRKSLDMFAVRVSGFVLTNHYAC